MRHRIVIGKVAFMFVLPFMLGCASAELQGGPGARTTGMRYYLPQDVVKITGTLTTTRVTKVEPTVTADNLSDLQLREHEEVTSQGTLDLQTLADLNHPYYIDLSVGKTADSSLTIEASPGGLLKSVNATTTGKAGATITSIGKFAASVASLLPLIAGLAEASTECKITDTDLLRLELVVQYFLTRHNLGCELWKQTLHLDEERRSLREERSQLEERITATFSSDLPALKTKIALLDAAINSRSKQLETIQLLFERHLNEFRVEKGLIATTIEEQFSEVIPLTDLTNGRALRSGMTKQEALKAIPSGPSLELFNRFGVAPAIDLLQEAPVNGIRAASETASEGEIKDGHGENTPHGRVYFRPPRHVRLRLFALKKMPGVEHPQLQLVTDQVVDVLHPSDPAVHVAFEPSKWAERGIALAFDDRGRPRRLERTGKSDSAAIASALAETATAARDEYALGLSKVLELQKNSREIGLADLSDELASLQREKEVLAAQLALEQSSATFDSNLRQSELAAKLQELQTEINLELAEVTREQKVELEVLKLELERLQKELELLRTAIAFEAERDKE